MSDAEMQTRKLQKVGGSTYTVSIPKRWAENHGLEAGCDVHLYTHADGSLVVRGSRTDGGDLDATRVEIDGPGVNAVERVLKATYAVGFDEVTLAATRAFTDDQRRTARALARTLIGTEIAEEDDARIVVRNLLDPADVSVRQSVSQLTFVALSMHRTATDAALGEGTGADSVAGRDDEADRLFEMLARHFSRSLTDFAEVDHLGVDRPELFDHYLTARQLERVADHAVRIARIAAASDGEVGAGIDRELVDRARESGAAARRVVEDAVEVVTGDARTETAHGVLDRRDEVVAELEAIERDAFERGTADAYHLTRVLDGLVRTAEYGGNVAEVAVESALRERD
ncbi:phosphate uptake regulator PhoU [Halorussus salilacus]|uniref:phosphate signaling complex PhoU family protein n=1 Tax=Halorussus salilacus TaxID=2953750 RepID=UPI00209CFCC6|nr:phosphate uptake regulator PhoU [Halorussus salilacus]USZ69282.1 phosphate uptake regulator PhoU [Halorussus salilacus]